MNKFIKLSLVLGLIIIACSAVAVVPAQVPVTGETGGAAGSENGIAWPSPRFVVGSGVTAGCITDKLTGLMWSKNGSIGFKSTNDGELSAQPNYSNTAENLNTSAWGVAIAAVGNMNSSPIKLCGYSDWRLPNIVELKSIINYGSQARPADWLKEQGFVGVSLYGYYWSSSTYAPFTNNDVAWQVGFNRGDVTALGKSGNNHVWPVRGGQ